MKMNECFKAEKITDRVYWVGAVDYNVRNFHGYRTTEGSTYNAFLILDEKITLIDTVKAPFFQEMMARIRSVVDPAKIDYIVSNHSEQDHSGALPAAIAAIQPEKVFASVLGERNLKSLYGDLGVTAVKTGDTLSIGRDTLHFVETKMLHWPDSMVSYLDGEKILFSQDAFGMHLAGSKLFADEYDWNLLRYEARKYFANILLHLSGKVIELLDSLPSLGLDIRIIAPDHGPIFRQDPMRIVELYRECALQKMQPRALVFYSTMWGATDLLAKALTDGIRESGVEVELLSLGVADRSEIITKVLDSGLVCAGAPTMNNNMYPQMADILCYMRGLKPKNHLGFAFGAYGWSGEGHKQIHAAFNELGFELPFEPLAVKFAPTAADLERIHEIGKELGEKLLSKIHSEQ